MNYQIACAAASITGLVRTRNEDNYCVNGLCRISENEDESQVISRLAVSADRPFFAVFDGLGGESCGDKASLAAALCCKKAMTRPYSLTERLWPEQYIRKACYEMNLAVCQYALSNRIRSMGTTTALLCFSGKQVFFANVGDSRIYRFREEPHRTKNTVVQNDCGKVSCRRLSVDHVGKRLSEQKASLTQYLGIPEKEMVIEPHVGRETLERGTVYLICSDGVTDMLSEEEMTEIVNNRKTLSYAVQEMTSQIMEKGAVDNATLILCEVSALSRNR